MCDWVREVEHASYSVQYAGPDAERSVLLPSANREPIFIRVFWVVFLTILLGLGIGIGCYLIFQEDRDWPSHPPYILMDRAGWRAAQPIGPLSEFEPGRPVTHVLLTQTNTDNCDNADVCGALVRRIQADHVTTLNMSDLAYNFMVAGDGTTYEGRGWSRQPELPGTAAGVAANNTLYVAFIGTFNDERIPEEQLEEFKILLQEGIERIALDECYMLLLHKANSKEIEFLKVFDQLVAENKRRKAPLRCT